MAVDIKVLGSGCPKCRQLTSLLDRVIKETGEPGLKYEKVDDVNAIISYGALATPGLVINGRLKSAGKVPSAEQIKAWILEAAGRKP